MRNIIDTLIFFITILLQNINFCTKRLRAEYGFKCYKIQYKKVEMLVFVEQI